MSSENYRNISVVPTPTLRSSAAVSVALVLGLGAAPIACGDDGMGQTTVESSTTGTEGYQPTEDVTTGSSGATTEQGGGSHSGSTAATEATTNFTTGASTVASGTGMETLTGTDSDTGGMDLVCKELESCECVSCGQFLEDTGLVGLLSCEDSDAALTPVNFKKMIVDAFKSKYSCLGDSPEDLISVSEGQQFQFIFEQVLSDSPEEFVTLVQWLMGQPDDQSLDNCNDELAYIANAFAQFYEKNYSLAASNGVKVALDPNGGQQGVDDLNICMAPGGTPVDVVYMEFAEGCDGEGGDSPLNEVQLHMNNVPISGSIPLMPGGYSGGEYALVPINPALSQPYALSVMGNLDGNEKHPIFCGYAFLLDNENMEVVGGTSAVPGSAWQTQACVDDSGVCPEPYVVPDSYPFAVTFDKNYEGQTFNEWWETKQ